MSLNIQISPDEEKILNDILDNGIEHLSYKAKIERGSENLQENFSEENNEILKQKSEEQYLINNIQEKPKSSALRSLLDEIKSNETFIYNIDRGNKKVEEIQFENDKNPSSYEEKNSKSKFHQDISVVNSGNIVGVKDEMQSLQQKIDELEKRLFNNHNFSEQIKNQHKNENSKSLYKEEKSNDRFQLRNVSPSSSTSSLKNSLKTSLKKSFKANYSFEREQTHKNDRFKNMRSETNENNYMKSNIKEWKSQVLKFQTENQELKRIIKNDRERINNLEGILKKNEQKVIKYNEMNEKFSKLILVHENLINQYEKSENIRNEQNEFIKSLIKENEILKNIHLNQPQIDKISSDARETKIKRKSKKSMEKTTKKTKLIN